MRQPEFCLLYEIRDMAGCWEGVVERDKGCGTRHRTDAQFRDRITQPFGGGAPKSAILVIASVVSTHSLRVKTGNKQSQIDDHKRPGIFYG